MLGRIVEWKGNLTHHGGMSTPKWRVPRWRIGCSYLFICICCLFLYLSLSIYLWGWMNDWWDEKRSTWWFYLFGTYLPKSLTYPFVPPRGKKESMRISSLPHVNKKGNLTQMCLEKKVPNSNDNKISNKTKTNLLKCMIVSCVVTLRLEAF